MNDEAPELARRRFLFAETGRQSIGASHKRREVLARTQRNHAEACGDAHSVWETARFKGGPNSLRNLLCVRRSCVRQKDQELLATPSAKKVSDAEATGCNLREDPEHLVAGGMTAGVVDVLEIVQIDHHH